ncbi:sulfotransferase [Coleofasciculus sp. F4-SAH-05]|uniref:sulfotransferase n=1 Tax=Coleofasciculus sp. F4-SAH-05 TaxID=3069525 RepID=UPI0032FD857F
MKSTDQATNKTQEKPIFLTGSHRSGTTWLGTMLALAKGTLLIEEPFNLCPWAYKLGDLATYWFTYAPELPAELSLSAYQKVLDRKTDKVFARRRVQRYLPFTRGGRLIIKDPIACFSSEWIYRHFDPEVIILVRHPAAFALSLKRMNWYFNFDNLLCQKKLMEELLEPYRSEMENKPEAIIDQAALLWKVIYHVLLLYAHRYPGWLVLTHEKLSNYPTIEIEKLYKRLGFTWNKYIELKVINFTGLHNPKNPKNGVPNEIKRNSYANAKRWKNILSQEEVKRIYDITYTVSNNFYDHSAW